MKTTDRVKEVIRENRTVAARAAVLTAEGYEVVTEVLMGTGGVGQVKTIKGVTYMQIGYGHTRFNCATCVII